MITVSPGKSGLGEFLVIKEPSARSTMQKQQKITRRDALKATAAAVAAPYVITSSALGDDKRPPASDRIVMAGIGIGNMGQGDLGAFLGRGDVQYVAASDVRKGVRDGAKGKVDGKYQNSDCQVYRDFREILARPDIDAVHIATPDHWHAIMVIEACRAGKDVYCQKPETLTLREGPLMIEAARRYARVVSGGSQRVLEDYRKVVDPAGAASSARSSRSTSAWDPSRSFATCRPRKCLPTSIGICGSARRLGRRTTQTVARATSPLTATVGVRMWTIPEGA